MKELNNIKIANKKFKELFQEHKKIVLQLILAPSVSLDLIYDIIDNISGTIKEHEQIINRTKREVKILTESGYYLKQDASQDIREKISAISNKYKIEEQLFRSFLIEKGYQDIFRTFIMPYNIKQNLDDYILGQESLKKTLGNIGYIMMQNEVLKEPISNNLLLIGGTGQGKTYSIHILAKILNRPMSVFNSSMLVNSGIVGISIEDILTMHFAKCNKDIEKMENSIIFLDEFDKLADSRSFSIQNELLSLINRDEVFFPEDFVKLGQSKKISVNLKKTLFVFAGTFSNLKSTLNKKEIGFDKINYSNKTEIKRSDFINIGFKKELIGRINTIVQMNNLKEQDYVRVMKSQNFKIIKQYTGLLENVNKSIIINEEVYSRIAKLAIESREGVRYVNTTFTSIFQNILFDIRDHSKENIVIDETNLIDL